MATRAVLNRSQSTTTVDTGVEYFFNVKLDEDKKVYEWKPLGDDDEGMEEDDEDFISHTLFLKTAVLGADCVKDQGNVVMMESEDGDGNKIEGAICHLNKTYSPMCQLDLSLNGKNGAKFTLVGGTGPVYITGNYVQDFPRDDGIMMDNTQTEDESENENENEMDASNEKMDEVEEVEDDEEEEEETKVTKAKKAAAAKRKATASKGSSKPKQKAKMDTTEEDVDDEEEEDEDENDDADDDDDEDYEESPPKKAAAKKAAAPKAQDAKKGKKAAAPEVTKKTGKKVKK